MKKLCANNEKIKKYFDVLVLIKRYKKLVEALNIIGDFKNSDIVRVNYDAEKYPNDMYVVDEKNDIFTFGIEQKDSISDSITINKQTDKEITYTYDPSKEELEFKRKIYTYKVDGKNICVKCEPESLSFEYVDGNKRMELYLENYEPNIDFGEKLFIDEFINLIKTNNEVNFEKFHGFFTNIICDEQYKKIEFLVEHNNKKVGSIEHENKIVKSNSSKKLIKLSKFKNKKNK